ncbi:MAG: tetratricopeptide repeat protein [Acidobacteriota bacterium]|nr:tetratricopeptide repeat protein [Acidobacteriota bacterium]
MTLALSMIVRNAAADLERCIASARNVIDEIVVADTGSTDGTAGLAWRLGARVLLTPWEDDFARARNRALAEVRSDWVLVLDADERLDSEAGSILPALISAPFVAGYQVTIRNYTLSMDDRIWDRVAVPNDFRLPEANPYPAYVTHQNVRLFRRAPGIHFVGRVHESVGPRIVESGAGLGEGGFLIHHFGLVAAEETRRKKNELYRELGRQKVREMPADAQAQFELGLVEFDNFHNHEAALACFEKACMLNPRLGVAWLFLSLAQARLGRHADALASLGRAKRLGYDTPLVAESEGDAHYSLGNFDAARLAYRAALKLGPSTAVLESKLGLAEVRAGRQATGIEHLRRAVTRDPRLGEVHDRLVQALVWLDRPADAASAAEAKLSAVEPIVSDYTRAASIRAHLDEAVKVRAILRAGLERFPRSEKLQSIASEWGVVYQPVSAALKSATVMPIDSLEREVP